MACCFMFIFCFLYLWVLSYRNFFLMSRLFQKFLKFFENSTGPDKKKQRLEHVQASVF